jgi:hypothetical protein
VVLLVNGVKEAFDDYWRYKSDEQVCCSGLGLRVGLSLKVIEAQGV